MRIIHTILDIIFPLRSNERLLRETNALFYQAGRYQQALFLSSFQDHKVRAAITENKYHGNPKAAKLLVQLLERWLRDVPRPVTIIPVPLHKKRKKKRGYNQVTEVTNAIKTQNVAVAEGLVTRIKYTETQTNLPKTDREKNVRQAFAVTDPTAVSQLTDQTIVILDDVVTTGATLNAVCTALTPHLTKSTNLILLALAH